MISDTKIIEIFCNLDDFMKEFDAVLTKHSISDTSLPKKRKRKSKMSKSEVMTIIIAAKRKKGMQLRLQNMVYYKTEMYLVFEIKNTSSIDLEVDFLNIYRTNGDKKRKSSFQKLELHPIYKYKMPCAVKNDQSQRFVYILPKFVLGDNCIFL